MTEFNQSEFNMALSYLARLNYSFWVLNDAKRSRDAVSWVNELAVITDELSTEKPIQNQLSQRLTQLSQMMEEIDQAKKASARTGRNTIKQELFNNLCDYERWIRKVLDEAGLLKKMKDSAADALK